MKHWTAPIYVFFSPLPSIQYVDGRHCHIFSCLGRHCKQTVWRYLDTGNKGSTSNLRKHVKSCWGEDTLTVVSDAANLDIVRDAVKKCTINSTITAAFEQKGKGKTTYSTQPQTKVEIRLELDCLFVWLALTKECRVAIIRWVAESLRPFEIIKDCGFQSLMKTGQPEYYLPHLSTVSWDVKVVFVNAWIRVASTLWVSPVTPILANIWTAHQKYDDKLSFTTDVWMSPNNKALMAISVHLANEGKPQAMVLDVIEVVKVRNIDDLTLPWSHH